MKKTAVVTASVLAALLLGGYTGFAADSVYELNPVVVTANKTENKVFDTQANIDVVTREQIEKEHYTDLGDALKHIPGVNLQNYGSSGDNYTSNRLYINGKTRVVVLIDGMRANTNGNASSVLSPSEFANMDTVERIEVLKGSASTLYGSDAIGGVINVITRKDSEPGVHTSVSLEAGSYNKRVYRLTNHGYENGYYWMFSAQKNKIGDYKDGHGNRVWQDVDAKDYNFMFGKELGNDSDITFRYDKYKSDYMRPKSGGLDLSKLKKNYGKKDNDKVSLQWNQRLNDHWKNTISIYRNKNRLDDNYKNPTNGRWKMNTTTTGFSEQANFKDSHNTLVAGFDYYKDKLDYGYYSISSWGNYSDIFNGKTIITRAFYVQDEYKFAEHWNITPGIRYTNTSIDQDKTTKSVTLGYNNGKVNAYAGYREFFRVPSLYESYSSQYGNHDLRPEKGHTIEAGVNYSVDPTATLFFNVYKTKADNMIGYQGDMSGGHYYNTGKEDTDGWSIGGQKVFNENWSARIAYTHTYIPAADSTENPNRDGYIPNGTVDLGVNYDIGKFSSELTGRFIINRPGRKAGESKRPSGLDSFSLWDLSLNYKANESFRAYFKVRNLFDKWYTDQLYLMDPDSTNWYSAPGRNYQFGVEYRF